MCFYRDMPICVDNCRYIISPASFMVVSTRLLTKVEGVEGLAQHFGYEAPRISKPMMSLMVSLH